MKVTRATAAAALAAVLVFSLNSTAVARDDVASHGRQAPGSLGDLARKQNLRVGTAVDMDAFRNDAVYRERIATEFSAVTAENVMKWQFIEPARGQLDFAAADELVNFARRNGQQIRGHTLLWHNQLPGWLTAGVADGSIGPDELRQIVRQHIIDEVTHFKGRIVHWDVVNEVIDDNSQLRDTIFLRMLGPGYIADAFRWAHQADRKAKLYLNDYNVEGINGKSDAYYALAQQLLAQGVPVHGFGAQGHYGVQFGFHSAFGVAENLRRFEALGLETSITEADVRMLMPPDNPKLQAQAQGYSVLMQGCLLARRCTTFTVWGYTDKYSWVPGFFTGEGAANILDENFQPKPAYNELRAVLTLSR
jgi:endo-1,4-beta-xylanase